MILLKVTEVKVYGVREEQVLVLVSIYKVGGSTANILNCLFMSPCRNPGKHTVSVLHYYYHYISYHTLESHVAIYIVENWKYCTVCCSKMFVQPVFRLITLRWDQKFQFRKSKLTSHVDMMVLKYRQEIARHDIHYTEIVLVAFQYQHLHMLGHAYRFYCLRSPFPEIPGVIPVGSTLTS